jgi:hypothetical protein
MGDGDGDLGDSAVYGGAGLIRDGFGMPDSWLAGTPLAAIAGIGAAEVLLAWRWQRAAERGRPGRIVTGSRDQCL